MATPTWLAATAGQNANSGQVNQFLGTHASTFVYAGTIRSQQTTAGSGGTTTNGLYLAQSFTTAVGQTTIGRVTVTVSKTGSPTPFTISIQANSAGAPSGTALVSTVVPPEDISGSAVTIPLPVTGLTASTTYWIVINAVGSVGNLFTWLKSNQVTGASTSPTGATWTAQAYGFLYQVVDGSAVGALQHTWEDVGARWTSVFFNTNGSLASMSEYTVAQGVNQYLWSARSYTYTNGQLTGVA